MDERKRILELVKKGVLSTEEALSLLENLAKKDDAYAEQKEFETESPQAKKESTAEEPTQKEDVESADATDEKKKLEEKLEELTDQINHYSVKIDQENLELKKMRLELDEAEAIISEKKAAFDDQYADEKEKILLDIKELEHKKELISLVSELDNSEEIASLDESIANCHEKIEDLNKQFDEEVKEKYGDLSEKIETLQKEMEEATERKNAYLREMHALKMKLWSYKARRVTDRMEIPDGWKDEAEKTINKAGSILSDTAENVGGVIGQLINKGKSVLDNFEWKDLDFNISVPKIVEAEFNHSWSFEDTTTTILDFKNSNGDILFEESGNDDIEIEANIKIYGAFDEETAEEALLNRMIIEHDADCFKFHIPNKRVHATMIVRLPQREYDYVSVNTLSGDINFKKLSANDVFIKSTNGDITVNNLTATMLEVKGTNGSITLKNADLIDLIASTISGDFRGVGHFRSSDISLTNGTIRLTLTGDDIIQLRATSVNGAVKIALPAEIGLDGYAQTVLGKVKSQLTDVNWTTDQNKRSQKATFERMVGGKEPAKIVAQTTTGNVLLKTTNH